MATKAKKNADEPAAPLNAGDDVGLGSSGGPTMTIERITLEPAGPEGSGKIEETAHVAWFEQVVDDLDRWTLRREKFPLVALRHAEDM